MVGGNVRWQGEIMDEDVGPNGENYKQDSLVLVDVLAKYVFVQHVTLGLNINNVFDKTYYSSLFYRGRYGEPRNVTATLKWAF